MRQVEVLPQVALGSDLNISLPLLLHLEDHQWAFLRHRLEVRMRLMRVPFLNSHTVFQQVLDHHFHQVCFLQV